MEHWTWFEFTIAVGLVVLLMLLLETITTLCEIMWIGLPVSKGRKMRQLKEDRAVLTGVDGFVDLIEERVASGFYDREDAKILYSRLKKCFPIKDLFPSPPLLKEAIEKRINSGTHAPVELPPVVQEEKKPRTVFDKK